MIVRTEAELDSVFCRLEKLKRYCLDTETLDRGYPDISLVGMSVGFSKSEGVYIPVGHADCIQLPKSLVLSRLDSFVRQNTQKIVVMHNAKYDLGVFKLCGNVKFSENIFDTMVASWLLDTEGVHGLKALVRQYLNYAMVELEDFCPSEKNPVTEDKVFRTDLTPIEEMGRYALDDATKPLALMDVFLPRLEEDGLMKVFCELEMPKVFMLMDIEQNGIKLDVDTLEQRRAEAPAKLEQIERDMYALRPNKQPFNAGSSKQLNMVLFDEIGIKPSDEPGKSGMYSTDKQHMEKWAADYPIVGKILEYRQVSKLLGTYLVGLSKRVGTDGRIRTKFNAILTTGRLSSSKPNLQNIPRPSNDQFGLRDMFVASRGKKLVVADYSQIELRVLAHISRDPIMTKAFVDDEDLHGYAAKVLFDLPEPVSEVHDKHSVERSIGKTFNFAVIYEAGEATLAAQAKVPKSKARILRNRYLERFHGITAYQEAMHRKAEELGYVTTLTGRRRHLRDAQLKGKSEKDKAAKSSALRQASNSPIQGTAADILFIAMRNIRRVLMEEDLYNTKAKLCLQVHDELVYEVDEDVAEHVAEIVKHEMEHAVKLRVPLIADTKIGNRWSDCK